MAENQIKELSPKHHDIMNYILANPTVKMGEVAAKYDMTLPWLSTLIHSDSFQALLRARQEELFQGFAKPLQEQLQGVAAVAIEKLGAAISISNDPKFALETTDKLLNRLGWNSKTVPPGTQVNMQQNNFFVNKEDLAEARSKMGAPALITEDEKGPLTLEADITAEAL